MAEVAPPPLHRGLPDEIAIWEILVRLPPKALLRCRAVCRAWRSATTARDFLLAHHARQPTLPLFYAYNQKCGGGGVESLDIIPFDHRVGAAAADRLKSVARIGDASVRPCVSCHGLVVLYIPSFTVADTHHPAAIYPHSPTGEYRILLAPDDPDDSYQIYTLGSSQPPRHIDIEGPDVEEMPSNRFLLFRGSLHWCIDKMISVFDTTAEYFWQMFVPVVPYGADQFVMDEIHPAFLFEMDGMLCMSRLNDEFTSVAIWAMQDYESEVWVLKYRVEFPIAELTVQFGKCVPFCHGMPPSWDGDVLLLVIFGEWLLQLDMDGKLVASFRRHKGLVLPQHQLKQTLVQHTFFPTLEGYLVNASPFI